MTERTWGPLHSEMEELLAIIPTDIPSVLALQLKLQDLLERLPPIYDENPVADFNHLYYIITSKIYERLEAGEFADPAFLTLLDVQFARRYFNALRQWGETSPLTPQAWTVLFRRQDDPDVRPLPAAAAGVNAHINYDLPFALIATWHELGCGINEGPQHRDYLLINEVFFEAIPELRRGYLSTWQRHLDAFNGRLDDWYQNLLVEFTRDLAWRNAKRIWDLREDSEALREAHDSLDRNTALLGRALLSPVFSLMQ